jgi:hypothetical protein
MITIKGMALIDDFYDNSQFDGTAEEFLGLIRERDFICIITADGKSILINPDLIVSVEF